MDHRDFFNKVALMRQLQKEYFRTRSRSVLTNCKNIESEVDAEVKRVNAIMERRQKE
nr:MAG TPA: hypothetical protein [Caudoviricetes sp.]DAW78960.1 MAG TPA: hypothetical protein [Caudoviricetes sp.]